MHSAQDHRTQTSTRRGTAAVVAFVFVAIFFALPLYAAMTLCTMPCCEQDGSAEIALTSAMPDCAQTCVINAADVSLPRAATFAPEQRTSETIAVPPIAVAAMPSAPPVASESLSADHPRPADAPLHVLNSVFRI